MAAYTFVDLEALFFGKGRRVEVGEMGGCALRGVGFLEGEIRVGVEVFVEGFVGGEVERVL